MDEAVDKHPHTKLDEVRKRSRTRRGGSDSELDGDSSFSLGMAEQILRSSPDRVKSQVSFDLKMRSSEEPQSSVGMTTLMDVTTVKTNGPNSNDRDRDLRHIGKSESCLEVFNEVDSNAYRGRATSYSSDVSPVLIHPDRTSTDAQNARIKDFAKKRSRSLCAPSPRIDFGPKASIMKSCLGFYTMQDPSTLRLNWEVEPESVLVIKKHLDNSIISLFKEVLHFLVVEKKLTVFVEESVVEDNLGQDPSFSNIKDQISLFSSSMDLTDKIDLIICMGGDGTLLHASSIFQNSVPPVLSFHCGSLGFLMPFDVSNFRSDINRTLRGNVPLILRSRLKGMMIKKSEVAPSPQHRQHLLPPSPETPTPEDSAEERPRSTKHVAFSHNADNAGLAESKNWFLVLNEIVIDRGNSAYISNVDLYLNGRLITRVQGDGLIISTPTGSTAYALAAGSSMVHPSVQSILITPICPHSLSFRPISVPAGVELKVMLSPEARNSAWVSFDGRSRQELTHGDVLRITTSVHPFPCISKSDQLHDWFESLANCLHWNVRQTQNRFDLGPGGNGLPGSTSSGSSLDSVHLS